MTFHVPEKYRVPQIRAGVNISTPAVGNNGKFQIEPRRAGRPPITYTLTIVASEGYGWIDAGLPPPPWEHVSVSTRVRCPTWEEMCYVKSLFWDPEDLVIQIHPPESDYINEHPYCLHLWRPVGVELPRPPAIAVGRAGVKAYV